jgi:signal transduction histidine kinase
VGAGQDGLADALRSPVLGLDVRTRDVKVRYLHEGKAEIRISLDASNHLFRIVQEALNSALSHAAALSIQVRPALHADHVSVAVSDAVKGLAPDTHLHRGVGFRTMRDRAAAIGARLTVTGRDIGGTVVRCECANAPPEAGFRPA